MAGAEQQARMLCPACNARYDGGGFCAKDGTPLVADLQKSQDLVGQVLAERYRIVRLLGEGGMGQVYEAQHVNINKRFAIKMLRPEIVSNPEAVQRFRQEAWSASSIGHENIIAIDDFATLPSGSVYLAMEFLQGGALAERMRKEPPLSLGEELDIFVQVARGLQAAHDKGIIHRDMKPENIYLAEKAGRLQVKILDFGIAKVSGADGASSLTRTGAIFGTPHYMSPEQALGKPLDLRSDIYSVGVIMYEVFTGRVPFEAESFMGILTKHITSEPRRPTEAAPERQIPTEIEAVILRAMAKDASDRYANMGELASDLLVLLQTFAPERLSATGGHLLVAATRPSQPQLGTATGPLRQSVPTPTGLRKHGTGAVPAQGAAQGTGPVAIPKDSGPNVLLPVPDDWAKTQGQGHAKKGKGVLIGGLVAALAVGGAVAFVALRKPAPEPEPKPQPLVTPVPVPVPTPVPTPTPVLDEVVIVDSLPPGAQILKDGTAVGETPEEVKVPAGKTVSVTLHKDGFQDEPVTVDPSKGHKLLVKLDKVHGGGSAGKRPAKVPVYSQPSPVKLPSPPPVTPAPQPVAQPQPVTPPPAPRPKPRPRNDDPYERLDDKPASNKKPDVLNPYQ